MVKHSIRTRLKAALAAATVAAGIAMSASADTVYDCFTVIDYSLLWHVECTLDGFTDAVDICVEGNGSNGWRALDHGCRGYAYLATVQANETVDAGTFITAEYQIEFPDRSDFIVAFVVGCSAANTIDGYVGWMRLAYDGNSVVLKGCALNTERGGSIVAGIDEPSCDLNWRTVDCGDHLELASRCLPADTSGRVVIPLEIDGKPVTSIGADAFYGYDQITSIQIPNSISNIGYNAFWGCAGIKSLSVPSSVTNMSEEAFTGCAGLQSLALHGPATIVANAVRDLPELRSLEFGVGVRTVSEGAVSGCPRLVSLTLSGEVERIDSGAFASCESLASASVHWLTKASASSFPDGCEITRYGIGQLPIRPCSEPPLTDAEVLQFVDIVGRDVLVGKSWLSWSTRPVDDTSLTGLDRACVRLGLHPTSYTKYAGTKRHFYFGRPTITVVKFDHASRSIRMKVNPPDGSHVAAKPMLEYIHLIGVSDFGKESACEIEIPLSVAEVDVSEYMSNGEFTLTYPKTGAQFFYLRIGDN